MTRRGGDLAPGRNGWVTLSGRLRPAVRRRAGAAPGDRAPVRRQRAGFGRKAKSRRRGISVRSSHPHEQRETGAYRLLRPTVFSETVNALPGSRTRSPRAASTDTGPRTQPPRQWSGIPSAPPAGEAQTGSMRRLAAAGSLASPGTTSADHRPCTWGIPLRAVETSSRLCATNRRPRRSS